MGRASAKTWTRITTELVGPGNAGKQLWGREEPSVLLAPSALSIKEFGILGARRIRKIRKEFRLCLGFALGQGCVADQYGVQSGFYFRESTQTLQHLQSPSAPSGISCGFPWQSCFSFLSLFPSCGSFQPHTHS